MDENRQKDVYEVCPVYEKGTIVIRKTTVADAEELVNCYADKEAWPIFNSDNCHGDLFHYETLERMKEAIEFWEFSYRERYFVRWTVLEKATNQAIGTVEMFQRHANDEWNGVGVLRIDLQSKFECSFIIENLLDIVSEHFYEDFMVDQIVTKGKQIAKARIAVLKQKGYAKIEGTWIGFEDYYMQRKPHK